MQERNFRGRGPRPVRGVGGPPETRHRHEDSDFGHDHHHDPDGTRGRDRGHAGHDGHGGPGGRGGPEGRGGRGGRRGRAPRGDVRLAVLRLLAEEPMHGYQLMQAIADRSGGRWSPSPGAIYPTLNQLEDEGLVTITADSGRKLVTLTDAGRLSVADAQENRPDPFAGYGGRPGIDMRRLVQELHGAARSVALGGSEEQVTAAAGVLREARRSLYLILAGPEGSPEGETTDG